MGGCYLAGHASIRNMLLFSGAVVVHEWSLKAGCFPDMHRCLSGFSHRAKLNKSHVSVICAFSVELNVR